MNFNDHIIALAEDTLSALAAIAAAAKDKLLASRDASADAFASNNTFTGTRAIDNLENISRSNREGYRHLTEEPAIARLVIEDDKGQTKVLYVARKFTVPLKEGASLASYQSDMGRLAAVPVGDAREIDGTEWTLIETASLTPVSLTSGWDAKDTRLSHEELGQQTIASFLALLSRDTQTLDDFEAMLTQDEEEQLIKQGLSHEIRRSMGLRDQAILDQFQDEIFRLPLNRRLAIIGPPGTGKTTTLIKRLSQKIDVEFLDTAEKRFSVADHSGRPHEKSWVMFTPTDLLKHYLKEAFNREGVPASDDRIITWDSHRHYLARNVLGLLQSDERKPKFILKDKAKYLNEPAIRAPEKFYDALATFHSERLLDQLKAGVVTLEGMELYAAMPVVQEISNLVSATKPFSLTKLYAQLIPLMSDIKSALRQLDDQSGKVLKTAANVQYKKNKSFFVDLANFVDSLDLDDEEDDIAFDGDQESENDESRQSAPRTSNQDAFRAYAQAMRTLARSRYLNRRKPKGGRTGAIIDWLGDNLPSDAELRTIGELATARNALNRFDMAYPRYVKEAASTYKKFRRANQSNFFAELPDNAKHISPFELDAVILLALSSLRTLMQEKAITLSNNGELPPFLARLASALHNQVLVDEATDFSALQLAAMKNLTTIEAESFFICGDFNQRITNIGMRDAAELKWVAGDIGVEFITTVYRQSRKLNAMAGSLLELSGGDLSARGTVPDHMAHEGVSPVLVVGSDISETRTWLASRIREIESLTRPLPTTAILVVDDEQAMELSAALNEELEDDNLRVEACIGGKTLGEGNNVRVFSVKHIKGLEFEAVFFVGLDDLASREPDLFTKYLYVGFTRAATYLGITCHQTLPPPLDDMRDQFADSFL